MLTRKKERLEVPPLSSENACCGFAKNEQWRFDEPNFNWKFVHSHVTFIKLRDLDPALIIHYLLISFLFSFLSGKVTSSEPHWVQLLCIWNIQLIAYKSTDFQQCFEHVVSLTKIYAKLNEIAIAQAIEHSLSMRVQTQRQFQQPLVVHNVCIW